MSCLLTNKTFKFYDLISSYTFLLFNYSLARCLKMIYKTEKFTRFSSGCLLVVIYKGI